MRCLHRRRLGLRPDPMRLARALSGQPGAFLLSSSARRHVALLGAWPTDHCCATRPEPELQLDPSLGKLAPIPRWVGILPYEAFRGLERGSELRDERPKPLFDRCEWWRYGAVAVVGDDVEVVGDDDGAVERLSRRLLDATDGPAVTELVWTGISETDTVHAERIRSILADIARGEFYQVNLARGFRFDVRGSALALYERWFERANVPFGFALDAGHGRRIVGASPELCLEALSDGTLLTRPIKGTRPRCDDPAQDQAQIVELSRDPKELAELHMVIDLERSDLGRVAETGSVEVLSAGEIESYEAVHHRVATLRARLRPTVSACDLLKSFLPSGSVTGTPKVAAMQTIAKLETIRRGLYSGAFGYLAQDGSMRLAMAIRTLVVGADGRAIFHSGGGIVADSIAEREVTETQWKAQQLLVSIGEAKSQEARSVCPPAGRTFAKNWADWMGSGTEE
jgi:anthranilate/para-aminobenzoate synthase component I